MPGERTQDGLCELINIGTGNGLTALSRIVGGRRLDLSVSRCVSRSEAIDSVEEGQGGVALVLGLEGELQGWFVILLNEASAQYLARCMLGIGESGNPQETLVESALLEAANILGSSFLNAVSTLLGGSLLPTPPSARRGDLGQLARESLESGPHVLLTNEFGDEVLRGRLFVALDAASIDTAASRLGISDSVH